MASQLFEYAMVENKFGIILLSTELIYSTLNPDKPPGFNFSPKSFKVLVSRTIPFWSGN